MNILQTIILGIVEGITEFLPVSSTFHLIWVSTLLGIDQTDVVKLFEVVIQAGAIFAVVLLYWKDLLTNRNMMMKVFVTTIPTAIIGLGLYSTIKDVFFESIHFTTIVFILVGVGFLLIEYLVSKKKFLPQKSITSLTLKDAVIIGFVQALAVVPGVSRAGSVIIGMMLLNYRREESAKYSFLVSVPIILAASLYDLYVMQEVLLSSSNVVTNLLLGIIVSFISAYIGVKWFVGYLQKNSLVLFGWYRIVVGIILLLILGMSS